MNFLLRFLSDESFTRLAYFLKHGKPLHLKNPRTFNEKINFIKLYGDHQLRALVSDRLKVRTYVEEQAPACRLINILWHGDKFTVDVYNELPQEFVIKANHGSKMVAVVDKQKMDFAKLKSITDQWIQRDYYSRGRERVYKDLPRTLIVEEKIIDDKGNIPADFKFFCINNVVEMVQVDSDRFSNHTRNLYNRSFEELDVQLHFPKGEGCAKPRAFGRAVSIAESLSKEFSFIRVDLYILGDEVYFGELTNYPGNGFEQFNPLSFDRHLGDKIKELK